MQRLTHDVKRAGESGCDVRFPHAQQIEEHLELSLGGALAHDAARFPEHRYDLALRLVLLHCHYEVRVRELLDRRQSLQSLRDRTTQHLQPSRNVLQQSQRRQRLEVECAVVRQRGIRQERELVLLQCRNESRPTVWWRRTNWTSLSESSNLDVSKPLVTSTITRRLPETMDSVSPQFRRFAHTCVERAP